MKLIVTTSLRTTDIQRKKAQQVARDLSVSYVERKKRSLVKLWQESPQVLLVLNDHLVLERQGQERFFFHPDTAMLRIKAPRDALIEMVQEVGSSPMKIIDGTMGMASDSIVMASMGHEVLALESHPLIYYLVAHGLQEYVSGFPPVDQAMRRIQTRCCETRQHLSHLPSDAVDIVYLDPMFSEKIAESKNLSGIDTLANHCPLTEELLAEAERVARKAVILKAHFRDTSFERFGFERSIRPYQKFHYGIKWVAPKK